jgi:hypothetical protein
MKQNIIWQTQPFMQLNTHKHWCENEIHLNRKVHKLFFSVHSLAFVVDFYMTYLIKKKNVDCNFLCRFVVFDVINISHFGYEKKKKKYIPSKN